MSADNLSPEEVLLLAQAALAPGSPVKVRSYIKHSTTGKEVVVRQAIRGAAGSTGRTPINPPTAQQTPVVSTKATLAEAAAARAGVAQQKAAQAAAQKQPAAALKAQKQQQKANKTKTPKTAAPKAPAATAPKLPRLGALGALGALRGGRGLSALRGRPGRLFPGSRALGNAMARSRIAKQAKSQQSDKVADRAARDARIAQEKAALHAQRAVRDTTGAQRTARGALHEPSNSLYHTSQLHRDLYRASARKVKPEVRRAIESEHGRYTEAAHRALEAAAMYRKSHEHGKHSVGAGFHEKIAGDIIKHEAKRIGASVHLSNETEEENPVLMAQEALRLHGYPVDLTGEMNFETAEALAHFIMETEGVDIDAYIQ